MAKTIAEIEEEVIAAKDAQASLSVLNSTSKVSIWRLFVYVFSASAWTIEKRQDLHKAEIQEIIDNKVVHDIDWYEQKALDFQYGHALIDETDQYDNTGLSENDIEAAKVVKYAAAEEVYDVNENLKGVRIKTATLSAGDLAKLPDAELAALIAYFQIVKDAGVKIYCSSGDADSLRMELTIYYDPLVLDSDGKRLDGTDDTPVQSAIDDFLLTGMIFNGLFVVAKMVDKIQAVQGIVIPHVESIDAKYGALDWSAIPIKYKPDSGYLRIVDPNTELIINWIAHA